MQVKQWHICTPTTHCFEEEVELGVAVRVAGDLKQGVENVIQQLLEIVNEPLFLVHVVEPWNLQQKCIQVQSALRMLGFPGLQLPELDIRKSVILGTGAHCTCLDEPQDICATQPCLQQHCRRCTLHLPEQLLLRRQSLQGRCGHRSSLPIPCMSHKSLLQLLNDPQHKYNAQLLLQHRCSRLQW